MDIQNGVPKRTYLPKTPVNATTAPDTADIVVDGKVTKRRPGPARTVKPVLVEKPAPAKPVVDMKPWLSDPLMKLATRFEYEFYQAQNAIRSNPGSYLPIVNEELGRIKGKLLMPKNADGTILSLWEGAPAWQDAAKTLEDTLPRSKLTWSDGLAAAAREHCLDMGTKGKVGHVGSDDSEFWQRAGRFGNVIDGSAESISYSATTGQEAALALFIDDGVEGRKHRLAMIDSKYLVAGAANCPHTSKGYGSMTVVLYAGGFEINQTGIDKVSEYQKTLKQGRRLSKSTEKKRAFNKDSFLESLNSLIQSGAHTFAASAAVAFGATAILTL